MLARDHQKALQAGHLTPELQQDLDWLAELDCPGLAATLDHYAAAWTRPPELSQAFFELNLKLSSWVQQGPPLHFALFAQTHQLCRACMALQQDWELLPERCRQLQNELDKWETPLLLAEGTGHAGLQEGVLELLDTLELVRQALQELAEGTPMERLEQLARGVSLCDQRFLQLQTQLPAFTQTDQTLLEELRTTPIRLELRVFLAQVEQVLEGTLAPDQLHPHILDFFRQHQHQIGDPHFAEALDQFQAFTQRPLGGHLRRGTRALLRVTGP